MNMNKIFLTHILAFALLSGGCATTSTPDAFTSDGCSLFPDGTLSDQSRWCDCCFNHDIAYWRGGSAEERKSADSALRACVFERTGNQTLAATMYEGVQAGGSPMFPAWYRWGYGWKYGRGYKPITEKEQEQINESLVLYQQSHPAGYCHQPAR